MIAILLLALRVIAPVAVATPGAVPLKPAAVLARYAAALAKIKEPRVLTFDYTLDQTGVRTLAQTHRVFRSGSDERDETLTVDGARLRPPKVRIFRGRRNRYTISALAPRIADYDFSFVGPRKNAHHFDYVFRLTPKNVRAFSITDVTIDGVRFLPSAIAFVTGPNDGSGAIAFGRNEQWWVPYFASAHAPVAASSASERLAFYTYRFPPSLPPTTFGRARTIPPAQPAAGLPVHGASLDIAPLSPVRPRREPSFPAGISSNAEASASASEHRPRAAKGKPTAKPLLPL